MSRNSEIDRKQLGASILRLSDDHKNATEIHAAINFNNNHNISKPQIHRYIQKHKNRHINNTPMTENKNIELLVAAMQGLPDQRDTQTSGSEFFGRYQVSTLNVFDKYYSLARGGVNGQVSRAFINLALKITNGIKIIGTNNAQDSIDEFSSEINFPSLSQDIARSYCEMGTVVVLLKDTKSALTIPEISPINYITLLTKKEIVGNKNVKWLIHGNVTQIVHGEGTQGQIIYNREDIALFRLWSGGTYFIDSIGRNTYGIWGESMIPTIETPLKSLMNASYYYDEYVKRYGMGRLHINMNMLADLLREGKVGIDKANEMLKDEAAAIQQIKANEDIITVGNDAKMLDVQHPFNITTFFEFREKQIDRALLQSDVSSGDVGSGFTNSGSQVSKQELEALQSLRDTFFNTLLHEVVIPNLEARNISTEDVSIYAEPLKIIDVNHRDLLEAEGTGNITQSELRQRMGFPKEIPENIAQKTQIEKPPTVNKISEEIE